MTLIDFINKYLGRPVDFDGMYGAQCVDLFRQYCKDVLEIEHTGAVEGAKDLAEKYNFLDKEKEAFCLIKTKESIKKGDVIIWGSTVTNPFGHVAICVAPQDYITPLVFEQNGIANDKLNAAGKQQTGAMLKERSLNNFIGILRAWGNT